MKIRKSLRNVMLLVLCVGLLFGNSISVAAATGSGRLSKKTFDADYYYNTYSDLQNAIGYNYKALYNHYVKYGMKEGRSGSAEFNCEIYMSNYGDLRDAFGNKYLSYCLHYEEHGKNEGRNATTLLDPDKKTAVSAATAVTGNVIGTYSTNYNEKIARATNVELAAARINGVVIQPGQEFSFSQTILPRTPENGYVQAAVIVGGKFVPGYGGGICQVSSTLYAAMLDADLPATERHPHSLAVSYISRDKEATISSPSKDLKFVNTFDNAIQLQASTSTDGKLTISIVEVP